MNFIQEQFEYLKIGLIYIIEEYPFIAGIGFIILGIIVLINQLKGNNSFKMSDYNLLSWKGMVSTWAVILMSFIFGLILIFKSIQ